jgi:hypothetical protein
LSISESGDIVEKSVKLEYNTTMSGKKEISDKMNADPDTIET